VGKVPPVPDKTPKRQAEDLKDLLVAYLKQETLDPLRNSGRYLARGIGGALLIGLGVVFLAIGALRALQTETRDGLDGNWTAAIYLIVLVLLAGGAAASFRAARRHLSKGPR
jgi:uncharacterized membrane protein YidH (DUF202 family)